MQVRILLPSPKKIVDYKSTIVLNNKGEQMGAESFFTSILGINPTEAFSKAVNDAVHWHGHVGYSGTIAEKNEFIFIEDTVNEVRARLSGDILVDFDSLIEKGKTAKAIAFALIDINDKRILDKYGPAGCIVVNSKESLKEYLFFGWASC